MVWEIIIIKFSCILKTMSRNTFLEHQPDSASYIPRQSETELSSDYVEPSLSLAQISDVLMKQAQP